jgi:DNA-binding transcriptional ArsR family regulator
VSSRSRLVGIRLAVLTLRMRENWRRLFGDDDAHLIALAIVAIVSERLLRTDIDPELQSLERPMPLHELSSCNINSIAAATGLNRETVRRKVGQLVERGLLTKERGSVRLAPGFTQQELACEVVKSQLDEIRRAMNDLIRAGAVTTAD